MDIRNYLERIGVDGPVRLDNETLFGLHRTHPLTVPFENLDIHRGKPIELDEQSLTPNGKRIKRQLKSKAEYLELLNYFKIEFQA